MSLQFPTKNELRNAKRAEREAQHEAEAQRQRMVDNDAKEARLMRAVPFNYRVAECNHVSRFNFAHVNWDWYIAAAKKLVIA